MLAAEHRRLDAAVGVPAQPRDQLDLLAEVAVDITPDLRGEPVPGAARLAQDPDPRAAPAGADGELVLDEVELGVRLQHVPVPPQAGGQRQRPRHVALRVVGHDDDTVRLEERLDAAVGVDELREGVVGEGDRLLRLPRPVAVGEVVVVGEREEHEVVEVLLDELAPDARRVGVAGGRPRQGRLAVDLPRRVELAVEELVRTPHGVVELRR